MKYEVDYLASMSAEFLARFYCISMYERRIVLQGKYTIPTINSIKDDYAVSLEVTEAGFINGTIVMPFKDYDLSISFTLTD